VTWKCRHQIVRNESLSMLILIQYSGREAEIGLLLWISLTGKEVALPRSIPSNNNVMFR
jgi:hypothetical protein